MFSTLGTVHASVTIARNDVNRAIGGCAIMPQEEDSLSRMLLFGLPTTIAAVGVGISLLPGSYAAEVINALATWACMSLPLGVLIGPCTLSEE